MVKIAQIQVTKCRFCPHIENDDNFFESMCLKLDKYVDLDYEIDKDCPLEDLEDE